MISFEKTNVDLANLSPKLHTLLSQLDDFRPFMEEAGEYMVRSVKYRIRQGWTDPDGEPLEALAELTMLLKGGYTKPLYQSGHLHDSVHLEEVWDYGFTVDADADYAGYVQEGVKPDKQRGYVKTPDGRWVAPRNGIPPRPFMGFSEENIRRMAKMLKEHILREQRDR